MTVRMAITCMLSCMFVLFCPYRSEATMGGVSNVGAVLTPGEDSSATREWIELEQSGDLLTARPDHDLLERITVYAPGIQQGHIILRELKTQEGKRTLLLTAPDEVMTHVQRATLYTQGLQENIVLFENVKGVWKKRLPQPLVIDSMAQGGDVSTRSLKSFSVKNLGFYWLLETSTTPPVISVAPDATSARTLLGGEVLWGFLPSIFGVMLFIFFGALSRWIHKTSKLREL